LTAVASMHGYAVDSEIGTSQLWTKTNNMSVGLSFGLSETLS